MNSWLRAVRPPYLGRETVQLQTAQIFRRLSGIVFLIMSARFLTAEDAGVFCFALDFSCMFTALQRVPLLVLQRNTLYGEEVRAT